MRLNKYNYKLLHLYYVIIGLIITYDRKFIIMSSLRHYYIIVASL
jgi:hypothetical protein